MIDFNNKGFFKLGETANTQNASAHQAVEGEHVIDSYKSMPTAPSSPTTHHRRQRPGPHRQQKDFTSLPYKNIVAYSVETSGTFDLDSNWRFISPLGKVKSRISPAGHHCGNLKTDLPASALTCPENPGLTPTPCRSEPARDSARPATTHGQIHRHYPKQTAPSRPPHQPKTTTPSLSPFLKLTKNPDPLSTSPHHPPAPYSSTSTRAAQAWRSSVPGKPHPVSVLARNRKRESHGQRTPSGTSRVTQERVIRRSRG